VWDPTNQIVASQAANVTSAAGVANFSQFVTNIFTVLTSGTYTLFFAGTGGDNNGAILDDIKLAQVTAVPLPASAWLLLSGLLGMALVARRGGRVTRLSRRQR
jgi:hypothetical protein